jgi:hypothetical protein
MKIPFQILSLGALATLGAACSSSVKLVDKQILHESSARPAWVEQSRSNWDEGGKVRIKAMQEVRGTERLSGCFDLARLNAKSLVVGEIQTLIKGVLDTHEATISEQAEIVLSKSRSEEFGGKLTGVRYVEDYSVRYRLGDEERIDCYVLSEISREDYNKMKRSILTKVEEADPKLKEQILNRHIDFFKQN